MVDWISDSGDSDGIDWDWDSDDEAGPMSAPILRNCDAPGPSTQDTNGRANGIVPSASLVGNFLEMGFPKEMILKCIKETGGSDTNALLELLLTYKALGDDTSMGNHSTSGCFPQSIEDDNDDDIDFENWDDDGDAGGREHNSDCSGDKDFVQEISLKEMKIKSLMRMGFPEDEANMAVIRCGLNADVSVLVDSIYASEEAGDGHSMNLSDDEVTETRRFDSSRGRKRARSTEESKKKLKRFGGGAQRNQPAVDGSHDELMPLPNPMVGFNLPSNRLRSVNRRLSAQAIGPPYFYYENVARAPKGTWTDISRFLYGIEPEFVDSMFFCAATRKRGYIHNLPIENRVPLLPLPPMTIFEAFPHYKNWWPSWDPRTQLNCLQTCVASAQLTKRIKSAVTNSEDPPPQHVQKFVMEQCKKWNLVWVGLKKVAPLEPHEIELLLGYPPDHTRGVSKTDRYKSLGNSFQVDTVGYHLSVLRDMFPNGMNVLSLFTGIGGGEVALHKLGIHMRTVVSVEISEVNRSILRSWWNQTQKGELIEIRDVQSLTTNKIESLIRKYGGFDLVIGGSPCNNLAGSNRHHRNGLDGEQSSLFYRYVRILNDVKSIMAGM